MAMALHTIAPVRRSAAEAGRRLGYISIVRAIAVRPPMQFAMALAFVLVAESAVLGSRSYPLHPDVFRFAVIFDICTVVPLSWWLLVVRRGQARPQSTARVAVVAVAACALVFGREVRLLAVPLGRAR